jgi:DNA polymerase I-like protein with 3'-5' exonuclease and polymerase domains
MTKNEVINLPVQGSAFHCLLWSFIKITNYIERFTLDSRLIGQVHNSMLFDILPDELPLILKKVYEVTTIDLPKAWPWIIVPLAIEAELAPVNASWANKEKIDIF